MRLETESRPGALSFPRKRESRVKTQSRACAGGRSKTARWTAAMRKEQPFETVTPSIAASEPHGGDNKFGNQRA